MAAGLGKEAGEQSELGIKDTVASSTRCPSRSRRVRNVEPSLFSSQSVPLKVRDCWKTFVLPLPWPISVFDSAGTDGLKAGDYSFLPDPEREGKCNEEMQCQDMAYFVESTLSDMIPYCTLLRVNPLITYTKKLPQ